MLVGLKLGSTPSIDLLSIRISPEFGTSNPAISLKRVVFPQPDGPRSEKNCPCSISNETPSTALTWSKFLITSLT